MSTAIEYLKNRDLAILEFDERLTRLLWNKDFGRRERLSFMGIIQSNIEEFLSTRYRKIHDQEILERCRAKLNNIWNEILTYGMETLNLEYIYHTMDLFPESNGSLSVWNYDKKAKEWIKIQIESSCTMTDINKKIEHVSSDTDQLYLVKEIPAQSMRYIYSGEADTEIDKIKNEIDDSVLLMTPLNFQMILDNTAYHSPDTDILKSNIFSILAHNIVHLDTDEVWKSESPEPDTSNYRSVWNGIDLEKYDSELVNFPSFNPKSFIKYIKTQCLDPKTEVIFMTLYRTINPEESIIIDSLIQASKLGKAVFVYVEPNARGSEEVNLRTVKLLTSAGVHVRTNFFQYKVHSKLFCVVKENGSIQCSIGTGNFHEKTMSQYTDSHYITTDQIIGGEVVGFLTQFLFSKRENVDTQIALNFNHLFISPFTLKQQLICEINTEAQKGSDGKIFIKCNSLCDSEIITALQKASSNGTDIQIIARTAIALLPTEHIQIRSVIGEFLEHDRLYIFGDRVYIASADMLNRNLNRRVEAMVRIESTRIQNQLFQYAERIWKPHQKRKIVFELSSLGKWKEL